MTNFVAIILGGLVLLGIGLDYAFFGTEHLLFLGKKFFVLLDYIAFWH